MRCCLPPVSRILALAILAGAAHAQAPCNLQWTPLTPSPQLTDLVSGMQVFDDGSGPALYICGSFATVAGFSANGVARWNGSNWSPLGSGLVSQVNALTVFDSGSGPALYAAGNFHHDGSGNPLARIARWDGASWHPLGAGLGNLGTGTNPAVTAMTVYDDGSGPALFVGGNFVGAGGAPAAHVAKWDGTNWSPLGSGLEGATIVVRSMSVFDDGSGPRLIVGGSYPSAGGVPVHGLASWDGVQWRALGGGLGWTTGFAPNISDLAVFDLGAGKELIAAGSFNLAGGQPCNGLARWNGANWTQFQHSFDDGVQFLHVLEFGATQMLALSSGGIVSRWDGQGWEDLSGFFGIPPSITSPVASLVLFDSGSGTGLELHAGGPFTVISGQPIAYVARLPGLGTPPDFAQQPASASVPDGLPVQFHATLSNPGPLSYQWTWFGSPISDDGNISGSDTDTLTIASVAPALSGDYVLQVTSGCLTGESAIAVLNVTPGTGQSFCFGNLTEPGFNTFCPCFNFGGPSRGCGNSTVSTGARLVASGSTAPDPTSGTDTVLLSCAGMTHTSLAIFLQGDAITPGGAILGDGVRCAGGSLVRLATAPASGGQASFPIPGGPSVSMAGGITLGSGATRYYQVWYRDPASFCTGLTYNVSSGIRLVW